MEGIVQVSTTIDSREAAQRIAESLVEQRLAACVQVAGPISSTYRWEGAVETAEEWLCLIKTRQELYPQLERAILALHPYDVPEILAVPVASGHAPYIDWVRSETETSNLIG